MNGLYNRFQKINWEINYLHKSITLIWVNYTPSYDTIALQSSHNHESSVRKSIFDKPTEYLVFGYV